MHAVEDPLLQTPWLTDLADLVRKRLGYAVPDHRLVREIAPFAVAAAGARGIDDLGELVRRLGAGEERELWDSLVDLATIGETHFFRHPAQLEALVQRVRGQARRLDRPLRIWSAGCSTGEEPLSVAMRLEVEGVPYEITASDVSDAALARGISGGPFSERSTGHLPASYRTRWMAADPVRGWNLARRGTPAVRYVRHNLTTDGPLRHEDGAWDVILCRNVLIYFTRESGAEVVAGLASTLAEDGSLWISPSDQVRLPARLPIAWLREGDERYLGRRGVDDVEVGGSVPQRPSPSAFPVRRDRPVRPPAAVPGAGAWTDELAALLERGLAQGALDVVERRLGDRPDDGAAWVARAAFHLRDHRFVEARDALDRARASRPRPEGLAYLRGTALLKTGRSSEALPSFLRALEDDPDDWASAWQAADLYRRQGRILPEELMLRRAVTLLDAEPRHAPSLGPAARLVNSVHRDPDHVHRAARSRLGELARLTGPSDGEVSS